MRLAALLADGAWHAGPQLAAELGVSRETVSARIAQLREQGLAVQSVTGRGYRLAEPIELLDAAAIRAALAGPAAERLDEVAVLDTVDSTNAEVGRRSPACCACFAEHQSAGRGRGERRWASPFASNLYLSLGWNLAAPPAPLGTLSLAVGVCLAEALDALGVAGLGLKWPNDIWAGARKLGGILIEHRGEVGGRARLIVGLGLNVSMRAEQAAALDQPWTRLADHWAAPIGRNRLAAAALDSLLTAVASFEASGFAPFAEAWARRDVLRDRPVRVIESHGERYGIARGIGADGALVVEIAGRRCAVYAGDVSLRLAT